MYQKDIETFDLEDFKYNSVNITAFRLVDVESPKVVDIMEQMKKFQHSGKDMNGSSVIMVKFLFLFSAPLIPNFYIKMAFYFSHCFFSSSSPSYTCSHIYCYSSHIYTTCYDNACFFAYISSQFNDNT